MVYIANYNNSFMPGMFVTLIFYFIVNKFIIIIIYTIIWHEIFIIFAVPFLKLRFALQSNVQSMSKKKKKKKYSRSHIGLCLCNMLYCVESGGNVILCIHNYIAHTSL